MNFQTISDFTHAHSYPEFSLKAVLFDMDGVLFDSMPAHAEAWVRAIRNLGLPFTHYEAYMNEGRTGHGTIDGIFQRELGRNATKEEKETIYRDKTLEFEAQPVAKPMPYAADLLRMIKRKELKIILVTGSGQASLLDNLERNFPGIFRPELMVTAFDVKYGKPNPEPYLMGLLKANVKPWEAVVVENAPLGVESASKAGIFTIAVNTGILEDSVLEDSGANRVLPDIQTLYESWNKLFN
jgi:HAD superfamily hydrolase (TIGR01509 family)